MTDINFLSKEGLDRYDNKMKNYIGIELTKAEYDQLSEEEKNKGTYWITDYSGSGGGSNIELDKTLSIEGKAADAKAVGDAINVRCNSEGFLEVKKEGEWIDTELLAYVSTFYLYNNGTSDGEFGVHKCSVNSHLWNADYANVSYGSVINNTDNVVFRTTSSGAIMTVTFAIPKLYDLTKFNKIVLKVKAITTDAVINVGSTPEHGAWLFISKELAGHMAVDAVARFITEAKPTMDAGLIELDISAVTGEYYIGINTLVNMAASDTFDIEVTELCLST